MSAAAALKSILSGHPVLRCLACMADIINDDTRPKATAACRRCGHAMMLEGGRLRELTRAEIKAFRSHAMHPVFRDIVMKQIENLKG